jgi:transposase
MSKRRARSCPGCQLLREQLQELRAELQRVKEQLAAARKDSTTSSKPPSSDLVKPPRDEAPSDGERRSIGGQPGHAKHERTPFPPEQVRDTFEYRVDVCPDCGHALQPTGCRPKVIQQVELQEIAWYVQEHRQQEAFCPCCEKVYHGVLPGHVVKGGLAGPRLTALVAFLKGVCHASYSTIRKFLRDVR